MPDIYDINYRTQAVDILPPGKRDVHTTELATSLLSAAQRQRDTLLGAMRSGASASPWAPGAYAIFSQVLYDKGVYECIADGTTEEPSNASAWRLIQSNFIGLDERMFFNGTALLLECALNKWFDTTFRQPDTIKPAPDYYTPKSDIYLLTNELNNPVFRSAISEQDSSSVGLYTSTEAVGNDYNFTNQYGLTILIPVGVFNALGSTDKQRTATVRLFADKYVTAGVFYNIVTY